MPRIQLGAWSIHYREEGAGIPLVLLHAIGLDATWWDRYFDRFRNGYRVVAIDLRGHGLSSPARQPLSLEDHAADVAAVIGQLGDAAHVAGVSMGGMVAQYLAIQHPEKVRSLGLISTLSSLPAESRKMVAERGSKALARGMAEVIDETLQRWILPRQLNSAFAARCAAQLAKQDAESWAANWKTISRVDTLEMLPRITCPVVVCTGSEDLSTTPDTMSHTSLALGNGRQVPPRIVAGAAHLGAFQEPDAFIALLAQHLDHCAEACHYGA